MSTLTILTLGDTIESHLLASLGYPANGTASRDSGLGLEGEAFSFLSGFPVPGQNGFPGFPFGFPAQGFAGAGDEGGKGGGKLPSFMDTGFLSGGNIDFMKMAALVSFPQTDPDRYAMISKLWVCNFDDCFFCFR